MAATAQIAWLASLKTTLYPATINATSVSTTASAALY